MNCLIAKIKRFRVNSYRKLISETIVFDNLNLSDIDCINYAPDHSLDEDSWFKIDNFKSQSFCIDILKNDFDSKDHDDIERSEFNKISYLISVQDNNFYFQKVNKSTFLRQKSLIYFGESTKLEENNNRLLIKEIPDAVYFKDLDALIFKSLATINTIFEGIDTLYREATETEVIQFLNESFIKLGGSYEAENVSKPNRKRISLIIDSLSKFSSNEKQEICLYINGYCGDRLPYDKKNGQFLINTDSDLKNLIYGIQERFYTTSFGGEKRLANSVKVLN
ncbi:ATP F0F1 synthase synthase [Cardiobacteriaceae bacterium TAE3-ERU3]|nr:ATP F0F1 synthase synthase [Cardiobacteriaceae bacterium TAE3-ERU3]